MYSYDRFARFYSVRAGMAPYYPVLVRACQRKPFGVSER